MPDKPKVTSPANIGKELKDLPLEYLISAPLQGAIKAQSLAGHSTIEFINKVCMTKKDGKKVVNMVDFIYSKPNPMAGGMNRRKNNDTEYKMSVPLMTMLPIPYIRIEKLTNHFDFKITTTSIEKEHDEESADVDASYDGWFTNVSMEGHVGATDDEKTKVQREANLSIDVIAVQDEMPKGLEKILDIFTDIIKTQAKDNMMPPKKDKKEKKASSATENQTTDPDFA